MEKRKINVLTIIIICIVALIVGAGIGYFVYGMVNKQIIPASDEKESIKIKEDSIIIREENKDTIENVQSTIVNENNDNTTKNPVDKINYDGTKQISIKGKTYTISYVSEKFEYFANNELKYTEVKLYLNDEKVKTLNLGYLIDVNHEFGSKDYGIELYTICEEYILIVVKDKRNDGEYEPVNHVKFCIINTNGEHIDTLEWNDATQISDVKTGKRLTYEINDDSIILYKENYTGVGKMKYIVIRDYIKEEILKQYNENEVSLAGK